jgi:Mn2+/Fe2+ NRAMP family transporter
MDTDKLISFVGLMASVILPFFNIPLIMKIRLKKSSKEFSLTWALGVWSCIAFMLPSVATSSDLVFRVFGFLNFVFFSAVVFYVLKYR